MLWMIAALLVYLWLLGVVSSYMMGGFIHLLVTLAAVIVLVKILQGRRPVQEAVMGNGSPHSEREVSQLGEVGRK